LTTAAFCDLLKSNQTLGGSDASQPGQSASDVAATLETVAKEAPAEIRGDLQTIVDAVRKSAGLTSGLADPTRSAAVASSFSSLNQSISDAKQHLTQFARDKCNVDLDSATLSSAS
jgi:hypothetical protein